MVSWRIDIQRGMRYLSKHDPRKAVCCFYRALETCPVANVKELAKLLLYLGMTLKKMGYANHAIKSWNAAHRLLKSGYAKKLLLRYVNTYGMEKQSSEYEDDWRAFYSIQLKKYLSSKNRHSFCCDAERDMVHDLILSYWETLTTNRLLEHKSADEKYRLFGKLDIVFPITVMPSSCVHVNFFSGKRLDAGERCYCGSGLLYMECCGRVPSEEELNSGIF